MGSVQTSWVKRYFTDEVGNFLSTVLHQPEALLRQARIGAQEATHISVTVYPAPEG
jgi:hypothetical protein